MSEVRATTPSRIVVVLSALTLLAAVTTAPVDVLAQPPTPPTTVAPASRLESVSELKARIESLKTSETLTEDLRAKAIESLQSAVTSLDRAARFESDLQVLEQQVEQAPGSLEALQRKLATPPAEIAEPAPDASLESLQTQLADALAQEAREQQQLEQVTAEVDRRAKRRTEAPARLAAVRTELEEVEKQLQILPAADEPAEVTAAARQALLARRRALEQEGRLLEREVPAYDATGKLVTAQADVATRDLAATRKAVARLQTWVNERRREEARENARESAEIRDTVVLSVEPLAGELVTLADELAERRSAWAVDITSASTEITETERTTKRLASEFAGIEERAERAGFTNAIGVLLRKHRSSLPNLAALRARIDERQDVMSELHLQRLDYENDRDSAIDLGTLVEETTDDLVPEDDPDRQQIEDDVRRVLTARRQYLSSAIEDANALLDRLSELDTRERVLAEQTETQGEYIAEHILWVQSARPLGLDELAPAGDALRWFANGFRDLGTALAEDVSTSPVLYVIAVLAFAALLPWQQRFRQRLKAAGEQASKRTTISIWPTVRGLSYTMLVSMFWPLTVGLLGWRVNELGSFGTFPHTFGRALVTTAVMWFSLEVFRAICRPNGLGRAHFGWPERSTSIVRGTLGSVILFALPLAVVSMTLQRPNVEAYSNSLGRVALILALGVTALAAHRILRPAGNVLEFAIGSNPSSWLSRTKYLWYAIGIGIPIALTFLSSLGYQYTARQLTWRLVLTIALVITVLIVDALGKRWLLLAHRRLAIKRARDRRQAAIAEAQAQAEGEPVGPLADIADILEDPAISLAASNAQIRVLLQAVFAVLSIVGVWAIWADVLPAFGILERVHLWPSAIPGASVEGVETLRWVTLASLLIAIGIAAVTLVASRNLPGLLEFTVLSRLPLDAGARYAWSAVCGYAITVAGGIVVFRVLGVAWESVQWLVAAMTVGLGFGLQEIFANFVSGLIILFERPIRLGDTVTVGDVTGTVARIRIRATTIIDWDRKELIVPNREFVTGQLVNWTLSDPVLRVVVHVGIAYGSDTRLAKKLLLKIADDNQFVLEEPTPNVIFWEFGDSTLNFELRLFVNSIQQFRIIKDEINTAIDDEFAQHGIEIAFPQRDLHIRSVERAIPLETVATPSGNGNGSLQEAAERAVARGEG